MPTWLGVLFALILAAATPFIIGYYRVLATFLLRELRKGYALGGRWVARRSVPTDVLWAAPGGVVIAALGLFSDPPRDGATGSLFDHAVVFWASWSPWPTIAAVCYVAAMLVIPVAALLSVGRADALRKYPRRTDARRVRVATVALRAATLTLAASIAALVVTVAL